MKNINISNNSDKPIYQQIYDQISTQIILRKLKGDTQLPSIRTAAKELRVSIITIKKTWELLEQNNYIYTVPGKGAFVKTNSDSFLLDKKMQKVENLLSEVIDRCKRTGISSEELKDLVDVLFED